MPNSSAVSLITSTAAAPSLSGQALPVICPSGRNTGFRAARPSSVTPAGPVVLRHRAIGQRDRGDLVGEEPVVDAGHGACPGTAW